MNLIEALSEAVPFTWRGDVASFEIDGVPFEVAFKGKNITHPKHGGIRGFEAGFYRKQDKGAPWQYRPTGEGNAFMIFATVVAVVKDFLVKRKPEYVWFVADEPQRERLYNRLINRLVVPGYEAEITDDGKYTLRRTKSVFEGQTIQTTLGELRRLVAETIEYRTVKRRPAHYDVVNYHPQKVKLALLNQIGGVKNASYLRSGYRDNSFDYVRNARSNEQEMPPITVDIWGNDVSLTDGRHRLAIALERGEPTILAHVRQRSLRTGGVIASFVGMVPTGI